MVRPGGIGGVGKGIDGGTGGGTGGGGGGGGWVDELVGVGVDVGVGHFSRTKSCILFRLRSRRFSARLKRGERSFLVKIRRVAQPDLALDCLVKC